MAKWTSALFSDIRNKLANQVTFSAWKGRTYMRAYVVPANPNTLAQQAHRAVMKSAVAKWQDRSGTPAYVTAWNAAALPDLISGFNLYVKDFVGSPIQPDDYAAAGVTKFSGENLTIPRNDVRIIRVRAGVYTAYVPAEIGGTAPAWEIAIADLAPALGQQAGDKIRLGDNRIYPDSAVSAEIMAKTSSTGYADEVNGVLKLCDLT